MAAGLLELTGTLGTAQFWPSGRSDADTATVIVNVTAGAIKFRKNDSVPFQTTHVFDNAFVRISRCGDTLARTLLYEAAVVILARVKRASSLKDWARAIAKRSGNGKARVALARKLSVILHSVWRSGKPFRWSEPSNAA